jgi:hypothetical protein
MIESLVPISAFGFALGIADAERIGANAKVQAANPINRSRFMRCLFLRTALSRGHGECGGTQIVPVSQWNHMIKRAFFDRVVGSWRAGP